MPLCVPIVSMSPLLFIECKRDSGRVFNPYEAQLARENRRSSTSFFLSFCFFGRFPLRVSSLRKLLRACVSRASTLQDDLQPCQGTLTAGRSARQGHTKRSTTGKRYRACLRETFGGEAHPDLAGMRLFVYPATAGEFCTFSAQRLLSHHDQLTSLDGDVTP